MSLANDCTADGEGRSDAPFCAQQPGAAMGYCRFKDCSTSDDKRPTGYMCFNIGSPSVPASCLKKS